MTNPGHDAKVMIGRSMIVLNKFDSLNYQAKLRKLDPSASPAAVDLSVQEVGKKVRKFPAVYKARRRRAANLLVVQKAKPNRVRQSSKRAKGFACSS
jgi:hypothetical protein